MLGILTIICFFVSSLLKTSFGKAKINRLGYYLYIEQYRVFFQKLWFSDKHWFANSKHRTRNFNTHKNTHLISF